MISRSQKVLLTIDICSACSRRIGKSNGNDLDLPIQIEQQQIERRKHHETQQTLLMVVSAVWPIAHTTRVRKSE